jgi:hypothetical protein
MTTDCCITTSSKDTRSYIDLEIQINDLVSMARISHHYAHDVVCENNEESLELCLFSATHVLDLAADARIDQISGDQAAPLRRRQRNNFRRKSRTGGTKPNMPASAVIVVAAATTIPFTCATYILICWNVDTRMVIGS